MTHVAHVGRASIFPGHALNRVEPDAAEVLLEQVSQDGVVPEVGVRLFIEGQVQAAAGGEGRRLKDVLHLLDQLFHISLLARPHQELAAGSLRNDVGRRAAFLEVAVQPGALLYLLTQQADPVVGEHEGVERIDALFRVSRRVRRPTDELELHVGDRQRPVQHLGPGVGMEHHRRIDFLEDARIDQSDLSAATFLGRRADDEHPTAQTVERVGERNPRPGRGGRNQVVAAAVAEATKRVVFREEGNRRPRPVAARRDERRRGVGDPDLDAETVFLEELGQPGDGLPFFVANLRIGVNIAANSFEFRPQCVNPGAKSILDLVGRRLSHGHAGQ